MAVKSGFPFLDHPVLQLNDFMTRQTKDEQQYQIWDMRHKTVRLTVNIKDRNDILIKL